MKFGVVVFPGSNCDVDCYHAVRDVLGREAVYIWQDARELGDVDCILLPGGFTYGDYLRVGALARFAPVMEAVAAFADRGGPVLGICNGWQILCEAGLLPGALRRNAGLRFLCHPVHVRVETVRTPFTAACRPGDVLEMPIAHGEGNYHAHPETLAALQAGDQIVFRYVTPAGEATAAANPNGSVDNIAGICNREGNVVGMMPHPERNAEALLGSAAGRVLFDSVIRALSGDAPHGVPR